MNRRRIFSLFALAGLALTSPPGDAVGQQGSLKDQLVGTWTQVSTKYKFPDGRMVDTWGSNPRGVLMLDAGGRMAFIAMRANLPKFAANDRTKGTPEENKAVVEGSFAYFGTYTVNEADHVLTYRIEGSTFPNFDGAEQKRTFTLAGDELSYTNPTTTVGQGAIVETVWKRAK